MGYIIKSRRLTWGEVEIQEGDMEEEKMKVMNF